MTEQFEPSCVQCLYFKATDAITGTCHRFPPSFAGESSPRETHHWRFPTISLHAWCGEFLLLRQPDGLPPGGACI